MGVTAENVTTQQFDFDQGGTISGTVQTRRSSTDVRNVTVGNVTLSHSQMDTPRTSNALTSAGAFSFATKLFPFTGTYYASPGNCDGTTLGGSSVTVAPLQNVTGVSLFKPSAQVLANANPGYALTNMVIDLSPTYSSSGCEDKTYYGKATANSTSNVSWWLSTVSAADNPGVTYNTVDATVPYGRYDACIRAFVPAYGATVYWKSAAVDLTDLTKVDTIPISKDPYSSTNKTGYGTTAAQVGC